MPLTNIKHWQAVLCREMLKINLFYILVQSTPLALAVQFFYRIKNAEQAGGNTKKAAPFWEQPFAICVVLYYLFTVTFLLSSVF
jgi:hypothetical protein